jgi:hypothetical protein
MYLDDELALISPVLRAAGDRFHLIGHSFGGAVALKAALTDPDRLLSLVVYEPVLFSLLIADAPESAAAREILAVRDDTIELVDEGNLNAAAQRFVDYWAGADTWAVTPEARRPLLAAAMRAVKSEWHAAFYEPAPLSGFASVHVPTLFLTGTKSMASALAVAGLVTAVLPRVHIEEIEGVGHMAPITHPDTVNPSSAIPPEAAATACRKGMAVLFVAEKFPVPPANAFLADKRGYRKLDLRQPWECPGRPGHSCREIRSAPNKGAGGPRREKVAGPAPNLSRPHWETTLRGSVADARRCRVDK